MSEEQTKDKRQRSFLLVYESNSERGKSDVKVENRKEGRNLQISDLSGEKIKEIRQKLIDELQKFGY